MYKIIIVIFTLSLLGCNSGKETINEISCEEPVEIIGAENKELANGYLISFMSETDIDLVSMEFTSKYEDLTIYEVFSSSKILHVDSSDETLEKIQCESEVTAIHYNNLDGLN